MSRLDWGLAAAILVMLALMLWIGLAWPQPKVVDLLELPDAMAAPDTVEERLQRIEDKLNELLEPQERRPPSDAFGGRRRPDPAVPSPPRPRPPRRLRERPPPAPGELYSPLPSLRPPPAPPAPRCRVWTWEEVDAWDAFRALANE